MYPAPAIPTEEAEVERVGWGRCRFVLEEAVTCFWGPCCPCQEMGVTDGLYFPGLCSPAHRSLVLLIHLAAPRSPQKPHQFPGREVGSYLDTQTHQHLLAMRDSMGYERGE